MKKLFIGLLSIVLAASSTLTFASGERTDIHATADQVQPLLVGMSAPEFTVRDVNGLAFQFRPGQMDKPLVLTFFRGGWCPYCNLHLSEFRLAEQQLEKMGFNIWFISIDKPELLLESLDDPDIGYTLFSDSSLEATRAFGLAFKMSDEMVRKYLGWDIDLENVSGESHHVLPAPATYIIGVDGLINFAYINPNYKVRLHPDVLLAAAKTYQEGADRRLIKRRNQAKKN